MVLQLPKTLRKGPRRAQAKFEVKVDTDATYRKLQDAGLNPMWGGGRPEGSTRESPGGESAGAQITVKLPEIDVTALVSKSTVQVYFPYEPDLKLMDALDVLEKLCVTDRPLLLGLSYTLFPQECTTRLLRTLFEQNSKLQNENRQLEEKLGGRLEKVMRVIHELYGLAGTDREVFDKIRPILKKAMW